MSATSLGSPEATPQNMVTTRQSSGATYSEVVDCPGAQTPKSSSNTSRSSLQETTAASKPPIAFQSFVYNRQYQILYSNDRDAQTMFFVQARPLKTQDIMKNPAFVAYIDDFESGPSVAYAAVQANLKILRVSLETTTSGKNLVAYFQRIWQLRAQWRLAAAEWSKWDIFLKMAKAFFIEQKDDGLKYAFRLLNNKEAITCFPTHSTYFANPENGSALFDHWNELYRKHQDLDRRLHDIKCSAEFHGYWGKLWEAVEMHEQRLVKKRDQDVTRGQQAAYALASRIEARHLNRHLLPLQVGVAGTRPMSNNVINAIQQIHVTHYQDYFNQPVYSQHL